jgi:hypothetical protein
MIVHAYYEDARVATGRALSPAASVSSLQRPGDAPGTVAGVRVTRLPVRRHQGAGIGTYLAEYVTFFIRATFAATAAHRRRRYALVQVHTLPDFLVFAGLPMRLDGVPLVLDLHEAMPEFFRTRFPAAAGPCHTPSCAQEALATLAADAVLTVNDALGDRLVDLGLRPEKLTIVMNTPSLALFDREAVPSRMPRADGRLRLVYTGAVTPTYELDTVLHAVAALAADRTDLDVTFDVYGVETTRRGSGGSPRIRDRGAGRTHGRIPEEVRGGRRGGHRLALRRTFRPPLDEAFSTRRWASRSSSRLPTVERYFAADTVAMYARRSADSPG